MEVKIKKIHPEARMPTQGTSGAACFDLYAIEDTALENGVPAKVRTGLAFEVPAGYCMVVYSRSSSALKGLVLTPLIVDSDYRGEVFVLARHIVFGEPHYQIHKGDRIAQVKVEKLDDTTFEWADELSETERGTGGYGSTGD